MNIWKKEPVLVTMAVTSIGGWIVTFLVTRGLATEAVASQVVQQVMPYAVMVLLFLIGVFVREYVTPVATLAEARLDAAVGRYAPGLAPGVQRAEDGFNNYVKLWTAPPAGLPVTAMSMWPSSGPATVRPVPESAMPTSAWSRGVAVPLPGTLGGPVGAVPTPVVPPAKPKPSEQFAAGVPAAQPADPLSSVSAPLSPDVHGAPPMQAGSQ